MQKYIDALASKIPEKCKIYISGNSLVIDYAVGLNVMRWGVPIDKERSEGELGGLITYFANDINDKINELNRDTHHNTTD